MITLIQHIPIAILIGVLQPAPESPETPELSQPESSHTEVTQAWTRRVDGDNVISLEIVSRKYVAQDKPDLWLVGVAHIADSSFYVEITSLLDEMDIVLYESVQPTGSRPPSGNTDEERVRTTQQSLEFVADVAMRAAEESNSLAESLADVIIDASLLDRRLSSWVADASVDAWGNQFAMRADHSTNTLTFWSYGSDGDVGGEGFAADMSVNRIVSIVNDESIQVEDDEQSGNIQEELASVLGLEFQLDALPYEEPTWFCSDMTIDEVETKLIEQGASTTLLNTITGETFAAKLANGLMKLIPIIDSFVGGGIRESARLLMIEMLSMPGSDQLLQGIEPELAQVIIVDRNTVLLGDIAATLELADDISSIGVLYGAGHMSDLAPRLNKLFGYVPAEERWFTSMSVNPNDSLLDESDMKRMRFMLRLQLFKAQKAQKAKEESAGAGSSE